MALNPALRAFDTPIDGPPPEPAFGVTHRSFAQITAMPSGRGFSNLMGLCGDGSVWRFDNVRRGWYPLPMVIIEPPPPKPPAPPKAPGAPRRRRRATAAP